MTDIQFVSDMTVELIDFMGGDDRVVQAARVSTVGASTRDDESAGLINYLARDRHGCYDSETEVLTREGWMKWPDVTGDEEFLTVDVDTGVQSYQKALRVIHKPWSGDMIRMKGASVDLLVTPDHKMLASPRVSVKKSPTWALLPASEFEVRSHRIPLGYGKWEGNESANHDLLQFVGFFIGDGNMVTSADFHLRRPRKIAYLRKLAANMGAGFSENVGADMYRVTDLPSDVRTLLQSCYTRDGEKVVPPQLLDLDTSSLSALLDGLVASDGHVTATGRRTFCTTSVRLRDQVQEVCAKLGIAATWRVQLMGEGHFGSKPVFQMTIYRDRNLKQRIGWTRADRAKDVQRVQYDGMVHCVTVPNGTVYVRRNGIPLWCGNSPFEHSTFQWRVTAPLFVWREHHRHRIASYNEESGRYKELDPVFYLPAWNRPLVQVGKPGAYTFEQGSDFQTDQAYYGISDASRYAYESYRSMLDDGIAREVARMVLPVNIMSTCVVTMNARALMNFLSLRRNVEGQAFPSFPQREIEMVAERYESDFERLMPLTHAAFVRHGRVSP